MTNITNDRVAAAARRITARTAGLKPETLVSLLRGMASRPAGTGAGQIDPIEKVLVRHRLELLEHEQKAASLAKEHEALERMPPKDMLRADFLARLDELASEHQLAKARAAGIAERDLSPELADAAKVYAAEDARQARAEAIMGAAQERAVRLNEREDVAADLAAKAIAARRG